MRPNRLPLRRAVRSTVLISARACLLAAAVATTSAQAAPAPADDDAAALQLADTAPVAQEKTSPWRISAEAAVGRSRQRYDAGDFNRSRLSLDAYYDGLLAPGWRLIFSDRVDRYFESNNHGDTTVNTLKETYLSWRLPRETILDAGRINARYGAAYGYNPTDFFRTGALRSVVSLDPNSLRENRLGTGMLRGQVLIPGGSLTAIAAPKLADTPSDAAFSPDFGATNNRDRWLVAASIQRTENFNPQFLIFGGKHQATQAGVNLTALLNQSTVAYVEWAGGPGENLYDRSQGTSGTSRFRHRLATGLTYTNSYRMSLTGEYEYNGAGMGKGQWDTLGPVATENYFRYRAQVQDQLDLPTRSALFFYGTWQDALVRHLDLRALVRYNIADYSRLNWIEARYHLPRIDLSLQLQHNAGNAFTEYGALPERQFLQTQVTYYF